MFLTIESNILRALALIAAKKDVRYYLNGISFRQTPQGLRLAATNGKRLLAYLVPGSEGAFPEGFEAILPYDDLPKKPGPVTLVFSEKQCVLGHGSTLVTVGLIDGKFPDCSLVGPRAELVGQPAEFPADQIAEFVKGCELVKGGEARWVTCGEGAAIISFSSNPEWVGAIMPYRASSLPGQRHEVWPDWVN